MRIVGASCMGALALLAATGADAAVGPDARVCDANSGSAFLVNVRGFKSGHGMLRVQLYGGNPADFLKKGRKLRRIDVPVRGTGAIPVCVAVPQAGDYAIAVRHDIDGNGKSGWTDGGGFSRNPKLSLLDLKPSYQKVRVPVGGGVRPIDVVLNYRHGLSIGPVRGAARP